MLLIMPQRGTCWAIVILEEWNIKLQMVQDAERYLVSSSEFGVVKVSKCRWMRPRRGAC